MEEKDLEALRELHNQESTIRNLSDPFHISQEEQVLWFQKISRSRSQRRYTVILLDSKVIVGCIRVDDIDLINKSATVGIDIHEQYRSRGLGLEAFSRIISFLFFDLGLQRLQLMTLVTNKSAIRLYEKLGFFVEGILRSAIYKNGTFSDCYLMSLLISEWEDKQSKC
jgi:RimJ/RimL family protein N-acetyltransferase